MKSKEEDPSIVYMDYLRATIDSVGIAEGLKILRRYHEYILPLDAINALVERSAETSSLKNAMPFLTAVLESMSEIQRRNSVRKVSLVALFMC